jgi:putative addiction module CopG family antidote
MRSTQQFSITLSDEMAEMVRARVRSGEYDSESEVVGEGLRALLLHERVLESLRREPAEPACDAVRIDPERAMKGEKLRASLNAARKASLLTE